ncbi:MAG: nicotinate phosphoribosyltransferase [Clostridiales bacterium]|jgi:nicotinate phosphoribosyltransferase|nr:nicotinate phosphoribosyltransferase [Clostridiales bacterium]
MRNLTLLTDYYQLTMMNTYLNAGTEQKVGVFDVFFRGKEETSYSIAAGLEQAVEYIQNIRFTDEDLAYLRAQKSFDERFIERLKGLKFTGDLYAVKEGTVVFPNEPILTVAAPMFEAQLVETAILNIINHQTLIATKSAKINYVADGKEVVEFGLRRAQGPDAGIYGTRATVIGGCKSTSNVYAAKLFGIQPKGTHAHSFVMSFDSEYEAFMKYAEMYPDKCLLLVDTYDAVRSGLPNAIKVFDYLKSIGKKPVGVRIDSGDLAYLSRTAREMLDKAGHKDATVFASGDIDENVIASLNTQNAKIDAYGIGTRLITGYDNPSLGGVYKLAAVIENGEIAPKMKISNSKEKLTNPGFKKICRIYNADGMAEADLILLRDEEIDESAPLTIFNPDFTWQKKTFTEYKTKNLTEKIIDKGKLVYKLPGIYEIRDYAKESLSEFYDAYKRLQNPHIYKVDLSDRLYALRTELIEKYSGTR